MLWRFLRTKQFIDSYSTSRDSWSNASPLFFDHPLCEGVCCFDLNISLLERVIWQLAKNVAQHFTRIRDTLMAQTNNTVKCFFAAMPPINPEKNNCRKI